MKSQDRQIREHLAKGKKLTPIQALNKFGCLRLSARINDIRATGAKIKTRIVKRDGKRFAEYSI